MVGILIAMSIEMEKFCEEITQKVEITYKGKNFFKGNLDGKEIVLALAGIGKVNAAYTTMLLLEHFGCDYIINTGVAGGLGKLKTLDVVLGDRVCQHDMDSTKLGDPLGYISGVGKIFFDCDKALAEKVATKNREIIIGTVASGDQFIADSLRSENIAEDFGAIACDMESGAVGHICDMYGTKFSIIRTISDDAQNGSNLTYAELCPKACLINFDATRGILKLL